LVSGLILDLKNLKLWLIALRLISKTGFMCFSSSTFTICWLKFRAPFISMVSFSNEILSEISNLSVESNALFGNLFLKVEIVAPITITRLILLETISCETVEYKS
jgi:hypothetical protein